MQYEFNKVFGKSSDFRFSLGGGALLYGLLTQRDPQKMWMCTSAKIVT